MQRIQTVYLLFATLLSVCTMSFNLFVQDDFIITASDQAVLLVAGAIMIADTVAPIFFYKNRKLQVRICYMAMMMQCLFFIALIIIINKMLPAGLHGIEGFKLVSLFPLINLILIYLSIRGIKKDEALIKSMDRLR